MSLISIDFAGTRDCNSASFAPCPFPMCEDDLAYHSRRAEEELRIAQEAASPKSRRFHYHLAALHLDRIHAGAATTKDADWERRVA